MCHGRRGCSNFALDPMKQQAPVWRESYRARVGAKHARWWVDGKRGNPPDYQLKRNRSARAFVTDEAAPLHLAWTLFTSPLLETNPGA